LHKPEEGAIGDLPEPAGLKASKTPAQDQVAVRGRGEPREELGVPADVLGWKLLENVKFRRGRHVGKRNQKIVTMSLKIEMNILGSKY
jgi:hypothetical protein